MKFVYLKQNFKKLQLLGKSHSKTYIYLTKDSCSHYIKNPTKALKTRQTITGGKKYTQWYVKVIKHTKRCSILLIIREMQIKMILKNKMVTELVKFCWHQCHSWEEFVNLLWDPRVNSSTKSDYTMHIKFAVSWHLTLQLDSKNKLIINHYNVYFLHSVIQLAETP